MATSKAPSIFPFPELMASLDKLPAKDQPIVLMCASGHRGGYGALIALKMLGYEDVKNLGGGMGAWKAAKMPVVGSGGFGLRFGANI